MPYRVEVGLKAGLFDARGERTKRKILRAFPSLGTNIEVQCIDVYTLDSEDLREDWIRILADACSACLGLPNRHRSATRRPL